jgi:protein-tyrosine phosphatase
VINIPPAKAPGRFSAWQIEIRIAEQHTRQITFDSISNFRDLGGYKASRGQTVAWRRLFRSGDLRNMTRRDFTILREEIGLTSVIDLRSNIEIEKQGVGTLSESGIKYYNVSFISDGGDKEANERRYKECSNMGEFYLQLVRQKEFGKRIIEALEVIAKPENHPLVFHCAIGKDRTGILAAILLSVLDVADEDIIEDYSLSTPYMEKLLSSIDTEPKMAEAVKNLPRYFWDAAPESMVLFLSTIRKEYGSARGYLESLNSESSLIERLEKALLT